MEIAAIIPQQGNDLEGFGVVSSRSEYAYGFA
jgi:hypothetical protein